MAFNAGGYNSIIQGVRDAAEEAVAVADELIDALNKVAYNAQGLLAVVGFERLLFGKLGEADG